MQVFIGIKATEKLQATVSDWQMCHGSFPFRYTPISNLHLTLVPPWNADDINLITQKLRRIAVPVFTILFDTLTVRKRMRMLWAEPSEYPGQLLTLKNALDTRFPKFRNPQVFRPHMTLAKLKDEAMQFDNVGISWSERVDTVTLFASHLSLGGSTYTILYRSPLIQ